MNHIAFVTCSTKPEVAPDDQHIYSMLRASGVRVTAAAWDDPGADWSLYDRVILRSTWNYHLRPDEFNNWLTRMEKEKISLLNPPKTVRWNIHKKYLLELSEGGVPIPETEWVKRGSAVHLEEIMKGRNWHKAVIKPAISATAHKTGLVTQAEAADQEETFRQLVSDQDVLVQRFVEEVQTEGEWSLLFFNKKFSHAVVKRPRKNDFRVQNDFGGTSFLAVPPEAVRSQAEQILAEIDDPLLYARVDGVVSANRFLLMELELIEPVLFFSEYELAASHFVNALFEMH